MIRTCSIAGILVLAAGALASAPAPASKPAENLFTITGKLATGVMAVGAETTGITVTTADKATYELEIKDADLKRAAEGLNGSNVTVTGTLTLKAGVEIAQRRIITVRTLEPAKVPATAAAAASSPAPALAK